MMLYPNQQCFIGSAISSYMVYGHIFCQHLSYHFPLEVPCLREELYLLKVLFFLGILTYLRRRKQLFFAEFIQCYLKQVVGTSKTDTATSKQGSSRASSRLHRK